MMITKSPNFSPCTCTCVLFPLKSIKFPEQFQRKGTEFISQSPTKPQCVMNHCQSTCHTPILFTHYTPVLQTCWHQLLFFSLPLSTSLPLSLPLFLSLIPTSLTKHLRFFCCALYRYTRQLDTKRAPISKRERNRQKQIEHTKNAIIFQRQVMEEIKTDL